MEFLISLAAWAIYAVLVAAAAWLAQNAYRAIYWRLKRDMFGAPVTLAPACAQPSFFIARRIALANYRGEELDEVGRIVAETGARTCRVSTFFNDHLIVVTADPAVVAHVTARNFENYEKGPRFIDAFYDLLGQVCDVSS